MANDGGVQDKLNAAKAALSNAYNSNVSGRRPVAKPASSGPAAPTAASPAKPKTNIAQEAQSAGEGIAARMRMEHDAMPSYKKGGKVKETGPAKMHKNEEVIKADVAKKARDKGVDMQSVIAKATQGLASAGDDVKARLHMRIEPTDDDKYIVHHDPQGGKEPTARPSKHVASNLKELVSHIQKHYGSEAEPDGDEAPAAASASA